MAAKDGSVLRKRGGQRGRVGKNGGAMGGGQTGRKEKDEDLAVKPVNKYVDFSLGAIFFALLLYLCYKLLTLPDLFMFYFFVGSLVAVAFGVRVVKHASLQVGLFISSCRKRKGIPEDCRNPMKSPLTRRKFVDQSWQLACHFSMTVAEVYLIQGTEWWESPATCFLPCPAEFISGRASYDLKFKLFYVFQLTVWVWTGFSCKWLEARRKDYAEMMTHHIATVMLVLFSFVNEELAIGTIILLVHDSSDIVLDLMKMSNYLKLEDSHGLYITETLYVLNTFVTWPNFRLYYSPYHVIWRGILGKGVVRKGGYLACGDPNTTSLEGAWNQAHACYVTGSCFWSTVLLCVLTCLHLFWFYLLLMVGYKLMRGTKASRTAKELYEGESE